LRQPKTQAKAASQKIGLLGFEGLDSGRVTGYPEVSLWTDGSSPMHSLSAAAATLLGNGQNRAAAHRLSILVIHW
jgi:hypothetical protein